jgi:hypothetical protein
VAPERVAAGLLAAGQRVAVGHRVRDPLEPDRGFDRPLAVSRRDAVEQKGGRDAPHDRPGLVAVFEQVVVEHREHPVAAEVAVLGGDQRDPVGVAVVRDAEVGVAVPDQVDQFRDVVGGRLRMCPAERRVGHTADTPDVGAERRQQGVGRAPPAPVDGVVGDGQPREVGVDDVASVGRVRR